MLKTDIIWPNHRRYKSRTEWEPIVFFSDCLCNATRFDLMLGFFSSSAISILANGFATFLYNGGKMRLIINDILTENDKNAIAKGVNPNTDLPYFDLSDIENIYETLSERDKHFFDCISWLIRNNRIEIKIISPKNGLGISHTKSGVFYDGINIVGFDGSCNFSKTALIDNIESLTVSCDWDGKVEIAKINAIQKELEEIVQEKDDTVSYISVENIKTQLTNIAGNKSLTDLLESEYNILQKQSQHITSTSIHKALEKAKDRLEAIIEKVKNNFTRNLLLRMKNLSLNLIPSAACRNKLFGIKSLLLRRRRNDLLMLFKILHGLCNLKSTDFFILKNSITRGVEQKLRIIQAKTTIRQNFFCHRVSLEYAKFSKYRQVPSNFSMFKKEVDKYLAS